VYVHVPFCRDRCTYCAFPTVRDDPAAHAELIHAILAEAARQPVSSPLQTLYLGGGTPGLLTPGELKRLLSGLEALRPRQADAEVTLEVNPSNVTPERLRDWERLGITRLSLGVQTFQDDVLKRLARLHDAADARAALDTLADAWPGSWSADLLVGWAGQTESALNSDLEELLARRPPHISVYGLTIEPQTPLASMQAAGRTTVVSPEKAARFDSIWADRLQAGGYERYEISNFALSGHRSRHNQVYWANAGYLGLGPGASSSVHPLRWSNFRDLDAYLDAIRTGKTARERAERLDPAGRLLETLAVGLRTLDGLPLSELDRRFGPAWRERVGQSGLDGGPLRLEAGRLVLSEADRVRVDRVVADLANAL
jgi:oxygen-independent coproporphyrinogen-3 oxidase